MVDDAVRLLAKELVQERLLPPAAVSDALHAAVASWHNVDYLLTWNCRHLANPHLQKGLRTFMAGHRLVLPEFAHPLILREIKPMKANPILEEVWRVKDQLAAEAGYDVDRFFAQLRAWSVAHPYDGPVVRNAQELTRLAAEGSALALRDKPPAKG